MAELVDALDSKSSSFGSVGSIPTRGTTATSYPCNLQGVMFYKQPYLFLFFLRFCILICNTLFSYLFYTDDLVTREVFERMDDFERVDFLFSQLESSYNIILQLQQNLEHNTKTFVVWMSMNEEGKYCCQQLGGHRQQKYIL